MQKDYRSQEWEGSDKETVFWTQQDNYTYKLRVAVTALETTVRAQARLIYRMRRWAESPDIY